MEQTYRESYGTGVEDDICATVVLVRERQMSNVEDPNRPALLPAYLCLHLRLCGRVSH
jgi:hypothetical protein